MTHELPRNNAYNGGLVPADQCGDDYYSDEVVAKREAHLSAKYGHLKAAADERQHERERIAEANRRSKERPPELTAVAPMGVDRGAQVITRRCRRSSEGTKQ